MGRKRRRKERLGKLKNLYNYRSDIFFIRHIFAPRPARCEQKKKKCVRTSKRTEKTIKNVSGCECERVKQACTCASVFILLFFHYKRAGRRISQPPPPPPLYSCAKAFTSTCFTPSGYIYILSTRYTTTIRRVTKKCTQKNKEFIFFS